MINATAFRNSLIIAIIAFLLFVPFLGAVHLFDWDEINFAECAREMLVTHDYFSVKINFQPFWEKPPIFIWMQALSMSVFGVSEFAARLPNAICGIVTLVVLYNIGRKLVDDKFGMIWALVYASSFLPHFYFKSGIIDPWFNLFIFLGVYYFILFANTKTIRSLIVSALFIGLGVLTKGPVAVLVLGLCVAVYWIIKRFQPFMTWKHIAIYATAVLSVGGMWFLMLVLTGNASIIKEFFLYQIRLFSTQDAGHGGPFYYHWVILLVGCFPASVFALRAFRRNMNDTPFQILFKLWMIILLLVVLIVFSIVKTKIVHYSSLCYFPLSYLGGYVVYKLMNGEMMWKKSTSAFLAIIASLVGIVIAALPLVEKYKQSIINSKLIDDDFAVESLKANVHWSGMEGLVGIVLIVGTGLMLWFIGKRKMTIGIVGIFVVSLFTINMAAVVVAPKVEPYSQGAAIEFYEYLQNKDCYVETMGFKSYANLFYSLKKEQANKNSYDLGYLLRGDIDKPAYFVIKITDLADTKKDYPELKEIYRKNGFVFLMRLPKTRI